MQSPAARKLIEAVATAAAFSGTIILAQALYDPESALRERFSSWRESLRDRDLFARLVRETIDNLPGKAE